MRRRPCEVTCIAGCHGLNEGVTASWWKLRIATTLGYNALVASTACTMTQFRWYVRKNDKTYGPFPSPQIEEYLLLGRLKRTDEISLDGQLWVGIEESGHFPPPANLGAPREQGDEGQWAVERARARQRWLDERLYEQPEVEAERRLSEPPQFQALRHDHQVTQEMIKAEREQRPRLWMGILALAVVAASAAGVWWGQGEGMVIVKTGTGKVDCQAVGQGVNWSACDKSKARLSGAVLSSGRMAAVRLDDADLTGADLSYAQMPQASLRAANLEGAVLRAVDLTGADLTGADLTGADLSYATMTGARLEGARLEGVRLDKASWIDGRLCAEGSVGACL